MASPTTSMSLGCRWKLLRFKCLQNHEFLYSRSQEAEIKNGRIAMLGVAGLIVPEFYTFPQLKAGVTAASNFNAVRFVYLVTTSCHNMTKTPPNILVLLKILFNFLDGYTDRSPRRAGSRSSCSSATSTSSSTARPPAASSAST